MENKRPILVTGSHRSGTTWVGKMIGFSPKIGTIWEPFNMLHRMGVCRANFDVWYPYVGQHNSALYENAIKDCIEFKYGLGDEFSTVKNPYDLTRMGRDFLRFGYQRLLKKRPLLKDPMAFFSAEWLAEKFDVQVIVLIRHPSAFASSLKIKDWKYPFEHFLKQPKLMDGQLSVFKNEIISYSQEPRDIIDQACLLWRMIYATAYKYQQKHPDWLFLRHEDLSSEPEDKFASVYDFLQVEYPDFVKVKIRKYTGAQNPTEQVFARSVQRNSRENILNWKNRLSKEEIARVFENTKDIASFWYTLRDW